MIDGRIAIANKSDDGRESWSRSWSAATCSARWACSTACGRSAEARALEPSSPRHPLRARARRSSRSGPSCCGASCALLAGRLRNTDEALADSVFLDVTGRTAKRLLELAGDDDEFLLPITQEELAGMVGASRERVNKAIASFIRLGWIDQSDRRYQILNRDQLEPPGPLTLTGLGEACSPRKAMQRAPGVGGVVGAVGRAADGRGRSRGRRPVADHRRRPAASAAHRRPSGGVARVDGADDGQHRDRRSGWPTALERLDRARRSCQCVGDPDHAVEAHGPVRSGRAGGLERVHAAHAEADEADAARTPVASAAATRSAACAVVDQRPDRLQADLERQVRSRPGKGSRRRPTHPCSVGEALGHGRRTADGGP